jgi:hypothetical protein
MSANKISENRLYISRYWWKNKCYTSLFCSLLKPLVWNSYLLLLLTDK